MARRIDAVLLKKLIKRHGKKIADVASEMDVSKSLLEQLMSDKYEPEVKEKTQLRICSVLGVSRNKLFPVGAGEELAS